MSQAQRKILCKLSAEYNTEMISSASVRPAQTAYAVSCSAPNNATRHCVQCCRWARAVLINCSTRNDSDSPVPLSPSCAQALQAAKGLKLQVTFPTWLSPRRNRPPKVSVRLDSQIQLGRTVPIARFCLTQSDSTCAALPLALV